VTENLIYELCVGTEPNPGERLRFLLDWLLCPVDSQRSGGAGTAASLSGLHVYCVAAVLWRWLGSGPLQILCQDALSEPLTKSLYLRGISVNSQLPDLQQAIGCALCSLCAANPELYTCLLDWIQTTDSSISAEQLSLLATASQSDCCIEQLMQSGFLDRLVGQVDQFSIGSETVVSADTVASVLNFLSNLSSEPRVRVWLESTQFLQPLVSMLLSQPERLSILHRSKLESAVVAFYTAACRLEPRNQRKLASLIYSALLAISEQEAPVLLEDERVYVAVECDPACELPPAHQHQLASQLFVHPKLGAGSNHRLLQVSVNTTVVQLLTRLTTTSDLATNSSHRRLSSVTSDKDYYGVGGSSSSKYGKYSAGAGKSSSSAGGGYAYESTKFGLQLIEQISSVAASADAEDLLATRPVASPLDTFASVGGLSLLAQLLPALYPGLSRLSAPCSDPAVAASTAVAGGAKLLATGGPSAGSANAYSYAFADEGSESYSTSGDDMEMYESNSAAAAAAAAAATAAFAVSDFDVPPSVGGGAGVVGSAGGGVGPGGADSYWMSYGPGGGGGVKKSSSGGGLGGHHSAGGRGGLAAGSSSHVLPTYSLIAFGLFLRLPGYDAILLARRREAQCLLRLALGVSDDPDGVSLLAGRYSTPLPILPFRVLQRLYQQQQTSSDDELRLRQESVKLGILDLCLSCLSVLSHHPPQAPQQQQRSNHPDIVQAAVETLQFQLNAQPNSHHPQQQQQGAGGSVGIPHQLVTPSGLSATASVGGGASYEEKKHYWAKGTGFGTGSTTSSWDAEQALNRQRTEEELTEANLQVIAAFINPTDSSQDTQLPKSAAQAIRDSCLAPAIASYLRNDSVLDMSRHVPLYRSVFSVLRSIACTPCLHSLLRWEIRQLLDNMRACVDTYANRLKGAAAAAASSDSSADSECELLIADIRRTASAVARALGSGGSADDPDSLADDDDNADESRRRRRDRDQAASDADQYCRAMKELQFDTYPMISTSDAGQIVFNLGHHYEVSVKQVQGGSTHRARRLAQETVTLSTSLPLSDSSTVFVRCDEDRLDLMKVLITGPKDTPYANGCFEFDVFFPQDYPASPPLVHLETTGNHSVRFNPNLYNDGKVCLSILNTWHGRPEEKWNQQTSSFLQVLVSIQSLILVSEPYFNEPGYERSRGTVSGTASCREYDANIRQATAKWAMLEQIKNPSPCFKDVVHAHFHLKRAEILAQLRSWCAEMSDHVNDKTHGRRIAYSLTQLKKTCAQLEEALEKLEPPAELLPQQQQQQQ
uniref:UBIQUITIN_CONJUGAT_2 domain-containing protein n=1 Tax=Macrostomum lignano TaxID=282301 RepID=A0A1I8IEM6_9PLAT